MKNYISVEACESRIFFLERSSVDVSWPWIRVMNGVGSLKVEAWRE